MSIKTKIEVDASQVKTSLNNVESKSKHTFDTIQREAGNAMDKSSRGAKGFGDALKGILSFIPGWGKAIAGAFALVTAGIAAGIKKLHDFRDKVYETSKNAKRYGLDVNGYRTLQYASNQSDVELENVLNIIKKIDEAIVKSEDGERKYQDFFIGLGISWSELEKLSPEKRVQVLTEAIRKFKEEGKELPKELFSKEDLKTIDALVNSEFDKFIIDAKDAGIEIDEALLKEVNETNKAIRTKEQYIEVLKAEILSKSKLLDLDKELAKLQEKLAKGLSTEQRNNAIKKYIESGENKNFKFPDEMKEKYKDAESFGDKLSKFFFGTDVFGQIEKKIRSGNITNLTSGEKKYVYEALKIFEKNTRVDDLQSVLPTDEEIAKGKLKADVEELSKYLEQNAQEQFKFNNEKSAFLETMQKINALEKKHGQTIDENTKKQMLQNARNLDKKRIAEVNNQILKTTKNSQLDYLADISENNGEYDRTLLKTFFNEYLNYTGESPQKILEEFSENGKIDFTKFNEKISEDVVDFERLVVASKGMNESLKSAYESSLKMLGIYNTLIESNKSIANVRKHKDSMKLNDANDWLDFNKDEIVSNHFFNAKAIDEIAKINRLKELGIAITKENLELHKEELDAYAKKLNAQKSLNMLQGQSDRNAGIASNALRNMGGQFAFRADIGDARMAAGRAKGTALTPDEIRLIDSLTRLQFYTNNIVKPSFRGDKILTNELASRGGFSSSVRIEKGNYDKEMLAYQKKMYEILSASNTIQREINQRFTY